MKVAGPFKTRTGHENGYGRRGATECPSVGVNPRKGNGPLAATGDHLPPSTVTWAGEPDGLVTSVVNDCTSAGSLINR